jgi:hypothetical protein
MAKSTELLKEHVKSYKAAIGEMAEYHWYNKKSKPSVSKYNTSHSCSFPPVPLAWSARTSGLRIRCAEPLGSSARSPWTGAPDDRPAELTECRECLVWGHLLHDHEQRRGPRLQLPADLVDELLVDTGLLDLAKEPSEACSDRYTQDRDEKPTAEEQPPEHSPRRPSSDRVMVGSGLVLPVLVAYDRRNFTGLDHELRLEPVDLVHGRRSRGGVRIRDSDQVGHLDPPPSIDVRSDQGEPTR